MRRSLIALATAGGLAALAAAPLTAAHAAGTVEVSYVKPQAFADIGLGQIDRDRTLVELDRVFQALAAKLPDGRTLKLVVTDVDLAGELEFGGWRPDLRVVRGRADWPRMTLDYSLLQDGRVLQAGVARLSDPGYTFGLQTIRQDEPLRYERRMIDQWFDKTFMGN